MKLRFQASGRNGYEPIIVDNPSLHHIHEFAVLRLDAGQEYERFTGDCEAILHVVEGHCSVQVEQARVGDDNAEQARFENLGGRERPFTGRPAALYIPPRTSFRVQCDRSMEATLTLAAADGAVRREPIRVQDVGPKVVGKDNWQRSVTMLLPPSFPSQKLILGETVNPSGNWSGVPAHKHDTAREGIESLHEELYYFRADRPSGWGLLRIYDKGELDEMILLEDRTVAIIPRGYHTVSAAPGTTMYYTFIMAGPEKEVEVFVDPDQAWIND